MEVCDFFQVATSSCLETNAEVSEALYNCEFPVSQLELFNLASWRALIAEPVNHISKLVLGPLKSSSNSTLLGILNPASKSQGLSMIFSVFWESRSLNLSENFVFHRDDWISRRSSRKVESGSTDYVGGHC